MNRFFQIAAATVTLSLTTNALVLAAPSITLEASAIADDNINKAQAKADISEDKFLEVSGRISYFQELNPKHAIVYKGNLELVEHNQYTGLEQTTYGAGVTWQFMTTTGFYAPFYQVSLSVKESDYETDIRDGQEVRFGFNLATRLTDKIPVTIGVDTKRYEADTEVFDTEESRLFVNFDYTLDKAKTLYLTYSYITGDIVSTATPTLSILNWAEVIEPDNAFGGIDENAIAYRLDAKTQVFNLGLNYAIDERNSLDASYMRIGSKADAGIEYDRNIFRISYMTRF